MKKYPRAVLFILALQTAAMGGAGARPDNNTQTATISAAFAAPLVATVVMGGTPTSGVVVTFTVPSVGASGTFAGGVNTVTTDVNGMAMSPIFTANSTAGAYTVLATVAGADEPTSFSLTNAAPTTIAATSGTPQSATISTAFAAPLVATVSMGGSPKSGVLVTFTAPASGASGTFAGGVDTATTDVNGIATSPIFTANATTGGPYTITALSAGASTPARFSLTNNPLAPMTVTATSAAGRGARTPRPS